MAEKDKNKRYLPHTVDTRYHAVKTYREGNTLDFVCRKYKISSASLVRWNKRFDGTRESLKDSYHRTHTKHFNAHTDEELRNIKNYLRRNPNISILELYNKLVKNKGYKRHPKSLYKLIRRKNLRNIGEEPKKN